jgi:hypothetical protein
MACGKSTPASTDPVHSDNTAPIVVPVEPTSTTTLTAEQVKFIDYLTEVSLQGGDAHNGTEAEIRARMTAYCIENDCWDWDSFQESCE